MQPFKNFYQTGLNISIIFVKQAIQVIISIDRIIFLSFINFFANPKASSCSSFCKYNKTNSLFER